MHGQARMAGIHRIQDGHGHFAELGGQGFFGGLRAVDGLLPEEEDELPLQLNSPGCVSLQ